MANEVLAKLFEHDNWANLKTIRACMELSDTQLDAEPSSATKGSIRRTLEHLVASQQGYLGTLTGVRHLFDWQAPPSFCERLEVERESGEALAALAREVDSRLPQTRVLTRDGYLVEPWVLMVQIINHATEHREQINSMLSSMGLAPIDMDGWTYAEATNAMALASQ
jgi:uncharacterized damage-inducible protein DinB